MRMRRRDFVNSELKKKLRYVATILKIISKIIKSFTQIERKIGTYRGTLKKKKNTLFFNTVFF